MNTLIIKKWLAYMPILVLFLMTQLPSQAQIPQGFNYQAIARDGTGNILADQLLPVRLTIQTSLVGGTVIWQETHSVTTNQFGVMVFVIGTGNRTGGSAILFTDIKWSNQPLFLKTEVQYPGPGYTEMGTTQLWSVPYSLVAKNIEGPVEKFGVLGITDDMEEALFEVKNKTGQTVFAVYNEGVRIYVEDGAKGAKGGFSIGGFGVNKAESQEYLRVTSDSTRVYVKDVVKGAKGGFSIGGFGVNKASTAPFLQLNQENYFIGHDAGRSNTSGLYNSFIGFEAGKGNTIGARNAFVGYQSGILNNGGSDNVFIGSSVGVANTSGSKNVFLGNDAGKSNTSGSNNIYIGYQAGYLGTFGGQNIAIGNYSGYNNETGQNLFIGEYAGEQNTIGSRNSFVGFFAGQDNVTGGQNSYFGQFAGTDNLKSYNTFIGYWAGGNNVNGEKSVFVGYRAGQASTGSNNVFLGYQAGEGNTGTGNVLLGYQAGYYSGAVSNKLYIDNSSVAAPLIGGDFSANRVGINRMPTTYTLEVAGTIWANGSTISAGSAIWSDARFKTNVLTIHDALYNICRMRGVSYDWDNTNDRTLNFPEGRQIGVIAQEVEKVFPELVMTEDDGYKSVSYEKMSAIFIEAFKEQQVQIENQQKEIDELKNLVNMLITNQ